VGPAIGSDDGDRDAALLRALGDRADPVPRLARLVARRVPAPPLRLAMVYRARNATVVARLVDGLPPGTDVRLWALDETVPALAHLTRGSGPGNRFTLFNRLLRCPADDGRWAVLADDDIAVADGSPALAATVCRAAGLDIGQPTHTPDSFVSIDLTRRVPWSVARETWYVEQGPLVLLSPAAQRAVLPLPEDLGVAWGVEYRWSSTRRRGLRLGMVDAVTIRHLAPAGGEYDVDAARATAQRLRIEEGYAPGEILRTTGVWRPWRRRAPWLGETVGGADRDADAVRSGADVDTAGAGNRDTDGVPVGPADAGTRRAGADPSGT
jgi:hypothetical protein